MNLAGQGNQQRSLAMRSRLDDGGYIMVVLLIGIAVTAVWMGALLPSWHQQAVRQKEADLIFRGEQYARAIALYFRRNQALPTSIDALVSQHYLRRKYLDPITGKDFLPVAAGFSQAQGSRGQTPAASVGAPQVQVGGGISGVRSTSNDTSIRIYNGQQTYSQFAFDYTMALQKMGVANQNNGAGGPARGGDGLVGGRGGNAPIGGGPAGGSGLRQGRGGRAGGGPNGQPPVGQAPIGQPPTGGRTGR